ncbi:MAG: hypothetical protein KF729_10310 [Sandaracinaceae bacterium]|nr:hypothetical protein [Sandaracinaceae bacterium]
MLSQLARGSIWVWILPIALVGGGLLITLLLRARTAELVIEAAGAAHVVGRRLATADALRGQAAVRRALEQAT